MTKSFVIGFGLKTWVESRLLAGVQIRVHLALPISLDALLDKFCCHWATRSRLQNVKTGNLGA